MVEKQRFCGVKEIAPQNRGPCSVTKLHKTHTISRDIYNACESLNSSFKISFKPYFKTFVFFLAQSAHSRQQHAPLKKHRKPRIGLHVSGVCPGNLCTINQLEQPCTGAGIPVNSIENWSA